VSQHLASRERVLTSLSHRQPDRVPIDFGGTPVTGIRVSCVAGLRDFFGLEERRCRIFSRNGGFVFNTIHNVQARAPVENIVGDAQCGPRIQRYSRDCLKSLDFFYICAFAKASGTAADDGAPHRFGRPSAAAQSPVRPRCGHSFVHMLWLIYYARGCA
jgi:hypothetical protein